MDEVLEKLVFEVFVQEERCSAQLRLTAAQVETLQAEYSAHCQAMSTQDDLNGKRWYLVRLQPPFRPFFQ